MVVQAEIEKERDRDRQTEGKKGKETTNSINNIKCSYNPFSPS